MIINYTNQDTLYINHQYDDKYTTIKFSGLTNAKLLLQFPTPVPSLANPQELISETSVPIINNEWTISHNYLKHSGIIYAQIVESVEGQYIKHGDIFKLVVDKSLGNGEPIEDIPYQFKSKFDEMVKVINDVQTKLSNGEFNGKSAYELAVKNGYKGTEQEWLESLKYQHSVEFETLANQVRTDSQQVSQDKQHVDTVAKQVDTKASEVSTNANQVSQDKAQVEADKTQVSQDKLHVDTVVGEFDTKVLNVNQGIDDKVSKFNTDYGTKVNKFNTTVTQANTEIDTKVAQAKASADNAKLSEDNALKSAQGIKTQETQIVKNKDDILKLAIKNVGEGNPCVINDSTDYDLLGLNVYGESEQNGVPTPDAPVPIVSKEVSEIKITGKNLIDYTKSFIHGTRRQPEIIENGVVIDTTKTFDNRIVCFKPISPIKKGKRYIFSMNIKKINGNCNLQWYLPNISQYINNNTVFTTNDDTDLVGFYLDLENPTKYEVTNIMFREAGTNDTYEPYKPPQIVTLSKPITLRGLKSNQGNIDINGVKYISDVICEKNGVVGVERNVTLLDIKNRVWHRGVRINTVGGYFYWCYDFEKPLATQTNISMTMANIGVCGNAYSEKKNVLWAFNNNNNNNNKAELRIGFADDTIDTVDKVSNLINSLPQAYICYAIATSTFEPLPQADQDNIKTLQSYYPTTIINTNAFTQANYVADTKLYIDNSIAKYHAQAQANQAQLMSLLPNETQATMIENDQNNLLGGI